MLEGLVIILSLSILNIFKHSIDAVKVGATSTFEYAKFKYNAVKFGVMHVRKFVGVWCVLNLAHMAYFGYENNKMF